MRNHGNVIVSLSQLGRWLAERAEDEGAMFLPETAAERPARRRRAVSSACAPATRAGACSGEELANFEPGSDIVAQVTVLAEGTKGHLTDVALDHFGLRGDADPRCGSSG